ncbi:MAG: preprotein translocase subunit SecG [Fidelibacterota bacterium]
MITFFILLHVLISVLLILVILMQSSKGGGLAGVFGSGGGTSAIFGGRGAASFLSKVTAGLAIAFMLLAILINIMSSGPGEVESLQQKAAREMSRSPASSLPRPAGQVPVGVDEMPAAPKDIENK